MATVPREKGGAPRKEVVKLVVMKRSAVVEPNATDPMSDQKHLSKFSTHGRLTWLIHIKLWTIDLIDVTLVLGYTMFMLLVTILYR